jgi:5-methylthioadenosine/S-adenosylhomocysteine deaminase
VVQPPIVDGAILINRLGRIEAVGPNPQVPRPDGVPQEDLGDVVILPGLINTHTHLELTHLRGQIEDDAFTAWIQHVRRAKEGTSGDGFLESARQGVRDTWRAGITTVADTGDTGAVARALAELGGRGIVYQEVFGPHPDQVDESFAGLQRVVASLRRDMPESVRIGVSPHAPYTVSEPLYRRIAEYARAERLPLAVHIAESWAEQEFVTAAKGPFAEAWQRRGIPPVNTARSSVAFLERAGVLGPNVLAIHAVRADAADIAVLKERGVAVAACPRSNRRHGHGDPPLRDFLAAGLPTGVGTDSVASVADLDLFDELRAARAVAGSSADAAVRLVTVDAAHALGLTDVGSLRAGAWADLCVVSGPGATKPAEDLLRAKLDDVVGTWVAGRPVYRSGRPS